MFEKFKKAFLFLLFILMLVTVVAYLYHTLPRNEYDRCVAEFRKQTTCLTSDESCSIALAAHCGFKE